MLVSKPLRRLAIAGGALLVAGLSQPSCAATLSVPMALATPTGPGASVGQVTLKDASGGGVDIVLGLHGLPTGSHGFHVHEVASCAPATAADGKVTPAGAAGPHLDPAATHMHMGPMGSGHIGDLPRIDVTADGVALQTLHVDRLKSVDMLRGHALMIHAGGDNYTDTPPLGGGGARLACGVVE